MSDEQLTGIASIDVAVIDGDLLWRVEHMNSIKGAYVKDFGTVADAEEELEEGKRVVLLGGVTVADDGLELCAALLARHPEVAMLLAVPEPDDDLVARARLAGIREVIDSTAVPIEDVAARVLELLPEPSHETPVVGVREASGVDAPLRHREQWKLPANLIIVTSAKGGEGVTTVAANLAASLAGLGVKRVALIDGDPNFGDLAMLLHVHMPSHLDAETLEVEEVPIDKYTVEHRGTGVRLVLPAVPAGNINMLPADVLLETLSQLASAADVVVVDAPLELVYEADLAAVASHVVLVTTIRSTSLKNAKRAARGLGMGSNLSLVVNEAGRHHREPDDDEIGRAVGVDVLVRLPYDVKLDRAGAAIEPTVLAEHRTPFAKATATLTAKITARTPILT